MAAIQTPGINPSVIVAPDYQTQQLEAQRRLELANALRQQAMTDTPGNGGSVSWTQGLARLAAALSASATQNSAYKEMKGANQAYAAGMARLFGLQPPQSASSSGSPVPQPTMGGGSPMPQQPPTPASSQPVAPGLGASPNPVQNGIDPLSPDAPPQAASTPPSAPPPAPTGGAPSMHSAFSLTGDPQRDFMLYMMDPSAYTQQLAAVAGKSATPNDMEVTIAHARQAMANGDVATAAALLGNVQKNNYIAPATARPGGWTQDPQTGQWMFHPQAPIPGAVPGPPDANGNMTWRVPAGTEAAVAERAQSQASGESAGKAPYQFQQVFNKDTGQMEFVPVSQMAGGGGGSLDSYYRGNAQSGGHFAASPPLGTQAAANTYGTGSANAFIETQNIANSSPQRVQSLREMEELMHGGLTTGPTAAKMQELAEHMGISFLAKDNAFVFNKDAARFIAQSAADLSLNGSDTRLGMVANASPNMKMTPQALTKVFPVMIGLEYAKMAKAAAAAQFAQSNPGGNAQFESQWRQNYDPRMFTAYAEGGPAALAKAPANLRAEWLRKYRTLKSMGVDFGQFAQ